MNRERGPNEVAMLIRLLVVLLTLVGPMPLRVCTCAASSPALASPPAPAPKTCRCTHCPPAKAPAPFAACAVAPHTHDEPASHQHDRDCPAANPRPLVRDAGTPSVSAAPTDCGPAHAVGIELLPLAHDFAAPSERAHAPRIPLYLAFLSLRT
jgi:hypothetical protein